MKKYLSNKLIKLPFKAARSQEAIDAVSPNFWELAMRRILQPKFKAALKQFHRYFPNS
jgi:hypothetical protein